MLAVLVLLTACEVGAAMQEPTATVVESPTNTPTATLTSTPVPTNTPSPVPTIALRDPTFLETTSFLGRDHVNWNAYVEESYNCSHFACDVCLAAREQDIRCAYVHLNFPDEAHAIIAFETTDQGLAYFDPQIDMQMRVEVGRRFLFWFLRPDRPDWPEDIEYIDHDYIVVSTYFYWNADPDFPCEEARDDRVGQTIFLLDGLAFR